MTIERAGVQAIFAARAMPRHTPFPSLAADRLCAPPITESPSESSQFAAWPRRERYTSCGKLAEVLNSILPSHFVRCNGFSQPLFPRDGE